MVDNGEKEERGKLTRMTPAVMTYSATKELRLIEPLIECGRRLNRFEESFGLIKRLIKRFAPSLESQESLFSQLRFFLISAAQIVGDSGEKLVLVNGLLDSITSSGLQIALDQEGYINAETFTRMEDMLRKASPLAELLEEFDEKLGSLSESFPASARKVREAEPSHRFTHVLARADQLSVTLNVMSQLRWTPSIIREIEFPPEYKDAGIYILSYFQDVLKRRNLDENTIVRIEQEEDRVRLLIETPEGSEELVNKTLEEYGQLWTGEKTADEFAKTKEENLELRGLVRNAATMIAGKMDIIAMLKVENQQKEQAIQQAKSDLADFKAMMGKALVNAHELPVKIINAMNENQALSIESQRERNEYELQLRESYRLEIKSVQDLALGFTDLLLHAEASHRAQVQQIIEALKTPNDEDTSAAEEAIRELAKTEEGKSVLRRFGEKCAQFTIDTGVLQGLNGNMAWLLLKPWLGLGG